MESVCWGNSTVGSNPTLSAIPILPSIQLQSCNTSHARGAYPALIVAQIGFFLLAWLFSKAVTGEVTQSSVWLGTRPLGLSYSRFIVDVGGQEGRVISRLEQFGKLRGRHGLSEQIALTFGAVLGS